MLTSQDVKASKITASIIHPITVCAVERFRVKTPYRWPSIQLIKYHNFDSIIFVNPSSSPHATQ
jgi:hypothetical protein